MSIKSGKRRQKAQMARIRLTICIVVTTLASGVQAEEHVASRASADDPEACVTVQDLMLALIDPSADALWESVGTIMDAAGVEERRPRTDEDWQRLSIHAVRLVGSANLLRRSDRRVALEGGHSENPGIELEPLQSEWLMREQPEAWQAMAEALLQQSRLMLDAVRRRDAQAIFDNGEALDQACEGCHRHFWYPDDVAEVPHLPTSR